MERGGSGERVLEVVEGEKEDVENEKVREEVDGGYALFGEVLVGECNACDEEDTTDDREGECLVVFPLCPSRRVATRGFTNPNTPRNTVMVGTFIEAGMKGSVV